MLEQVRKVETNRRHFHRRFRRIIMGQDEKALVRLWHDKCGEIGPEDVSTKPDRRRRRLVNAKGQTGVPPFTPSCVYEIERRRRRRFRQ
jgi:hypothetical protein